MSSLASALDGVLLVPEAGRPVVGPVLVRIEELIAAVQNETLVTLQDNESAFSNQLQLSEYLSSEITSRVALLVQLQSQLNDQNTGVVPELLRFLSLHAELTKRSLSTERLHGALQVLSHAHRSVVHLASLLNEGDLPEASEQCNKVLPQINNVTDSLGHIALATTISSRFMNYRDDLCDLIDKSFHSFFEFGDQAVSVHTSIPVKASSTLTLPDACQALHQLSSLESHFETISRRLVKTFIIPLVSEYPSCNLELVSTLRQSPNSSETQLSLQEKPDSSHQDTIKALGVFLETIKSLPLPSSFFSIICASTLKTFLEDYLRPYLPTSLSEFSVYQQILKDSVRLEAAYYDASFSSDTQRPISEWNEQIATRWAEKRVATQLEIVRSMMLDWGSWKAETVPLKEANHPPKSLLEKFALKPSSVLPTSVSVEEKQDAESKDNQLPASEDRNDEEEMDGWGFDESERVDEEAPEEEADGWGFDEPDETFMTAADDGFTQTLALQKSAESENPAESTETWEWDDDEGDGIEDENARNISKRRATRGAGKSRKKEDTPLHVLGDDFPKLMISSQCRPVLNSMKGMLEEVDTLTKIESDDTSLIPLKSSIPTLLDGATDLFFLFQAYMPVQHQQSLNSVPALAMQFSNDCQWLAIESATEIEERFNGLAASEDWVGNVDETTSTLWELGILCREKQKEVQLSSLLEMMDDANGFQDTSDPNVFESCERSINQIIASIEQLAHSWKPFMTKEQFETSIGNLIDQILRRMLQEVEHQQDISEEESMRLNSLCKQLHSLDKLFTEADGTSSIGMHVQTWFKFVYLSELLEASMADIMFLYSEGHLVDFQPLEVVNLIRALFSHSTRREQNIAKILSASTHTQES